MKSYLILTAVGPDRPGLVDQVSAYLSERNFNIESSRMAALGGEFAIILLASGEEAEVEALLKDHSALASSSGLQVQARAASAPEPRAMPASLPYRLRVTSMDHPGIVRQVSRALHQRQINIESLDARVSPAPVSGVPVFNLEATLSVPASLKLRELRRELEDLADELNLDLELESEERTP